MNATKASKRKARKRPVKVIVGGIGQAVELMRLLLIEQLCWQKLAEQAPREVS